MTRNAILTLPAAQTAGLFLVGFLLLDLLTFSAGFSPLGITPWNPAMGLGVALVLLKGLRFAPMLAVAPLLGELLVRQVAFPWWVAVVASGLVGAGYALALGFLLAPRRAFHPALQQLSDLLQLFAVVVAAAAAVAVAYVGVLVAAGLLPASEFISSALRYFVGDVIGIAVVAPFVLILLSAARMARPGLEMAAQTAAVLLSVLVVLGPGARYQSQLFYLLFLPVAWAAVRSGLAGASAALVLMQVGIMVGVHAGRRDSVDVTELQAVLLVLVLAGLAIGMLTSERERSERRLRRQQDAIARAARMGSSESIAGTIAHEVNQPLTAIANYARAAGRFLDAEKPRREEAAHAVRQIAAQVTRASAIIRRVREYIATGRADPVPHDIARIIAETLAVLAPEIETRHASVEVAIARGLPKVAADELQILQVLVNVVRNALEALDAAPAASRRISIRARDCGDGRIEISIRDRGPGWPEDFRIEPLSPYPSEKAHGLGIGLALCSSIAEAHGGRLEIVRRTPGAEVRFTLRACEGGAA